jgi:hypothetical protein
MGRDQGHGRLSLFPHGRCDALWMRKCGRRRQGPVEGRRTRSGYSTSTVQYTPQAARCTHRIFGSISQLAAVRQIEVYALHAADATARPEVAYYCIVGHLSEE